MSPPRSAPGNTGQIPAPPHSLRGSFLEAAKQTAERFFSMLTVKRTKGKALGALETLEAPGNPGRIENEIARKAAAAPQGPIQPTFVSGHADAAAHVLPVADIEKDALNKIEYAAESICSYVLQSDSIEDVLFLVQKDFLERIRSIENELVAHTKKPMNIIGGRGIRPRFIISEQAMKDECLVHVLMDLDEFWTLEIARSHVNELSPHSYGIGQVQPLGTQTENGKFFEIILEADEWFRCAEKYTEAVKNAFESIADVLFRRIQQMESDRTQHFFDPVTGLKNTTAYAYLLGAFERENIPHGIVEMELHASELIRMLSGGDQHYGKEAVVRTVAGFLKRIEGGKDRAFSVDGKIRFVSEKKPGDGDDIALIGQILAAFNAKLEKHGDSSVIEHRIIKDATAD